MDGLDFSVSVSTYNRINTLKIFLDFWSNQTILPREICIGIDGSNDDTLNFLKDKCLSYPFKIKFNYFNRIQNYYGLARCHNWNFNNSEGSYILITDDDAAPHKRLLEHHIEKHLEYKNNIIVVGNRSTFLPYEIEDIYNKNEWEKLEISIDNPDHINCIFNNVSLRRDFLIGVGGYNEKLIHYMDALDSDLGRRIVDKYEVKKVFCKKSFTSRYTHPNDFQPSETRKL